MLKITLEHYKNLAEVTEYKITQGGFIEYIFYPVCDGFVSILGERYNVRCGVCVIDAAKFKEDEIFPTLILPEIKIPLPALIRDEESYKIKTYDDESMRRLSLNELRMTKRISELEEKLELLSKKVYNTTIF